MYIYIYIYIYLVLKRHRGIMYVVFSVLHIMLCISELCHPRCAFKLYGEVNSIKNTTINIWLNDGVY